MVMKAADMFRKEEHLEEDELSALSVIPTQRELDELNTEGFEVEVELRKIKALMLEHPNHQFYRIIIHNKIVRDAVKRALIRRGWGIQVSAASSEGVFDVCRVKRHP
jgi:hypothetical protein